MRLGNKKYKKYLDDRKEIKKKIASKYHHKEDKKSKKWVPIKPKSLLNLDLDLDIENMQLATAPGSSESLGSSSFEVEEYAMSLDTSTLPEDYEDSDESSELSDDLDFPEMPGVVEVPELP